MFIVFFVRNEGSLGAVGVGTDSGADACTGSGVGVGSGVGIGSIGSVGVASGCCVLWVIAFMAATPLSPKGMVAKGPPRHIWARSVGAAGEAAAKRLSAQFSALDFG